MTDRLTFPLGEHGRLGNQLFQLAATVGTARRRDMRPQFPPDWPYRPYFSLPDEWYGIEPATDSRRYVDGNHWRQTYMQDPGLWANVADEIRAAFQPSKRAQAVLTSIPEPDDRDVAAHVRRTDYATMPDHLPLLGASYYRRAATVYERLGPFQVDVYGDDLEWADENLPPNWFAVSYGRTVTDEVTDWCDLFQMARYRRLIIANSSYSWWSAWLAGPSAIVCYPAVWFGPKIDALPPTTAGGPWIQVPA